MSGIINGTVNKAIGKGFFHFKYLMIEKNF